MPELYRENQVQKYLSPEPCIFYPEYTEAIPGDFSFPSLLTW